MENGVYRGVIAAVDERQQLHINITGYGLVVADIMNYNPNNPLFAIGHEVDVVILDGVPVSVNDIDE